MKGTENIAWPAEHGEKVQAEIHICKYERGTYSRKVCGVKKILWSN